MPTSVDAHELLGALYFLKVYEQSPRTKFKSRLHQTQGGSRDGSKVRARTLLLSHRPIASARATSRLPS